MIGMPSSTESLLIGKTLKSNICTMDCCVFLQVASCYFRFDQLVHPEIAGEPYLFDGNEGILMRDHIVDIQIRLFIMNTQVCAYIHSNDTIASFSLTTILHGSTHKRISEYIVYFYR